MKNPISQFLDIKNKKNNSSMNSKKAWIMEDIANLGLQSLMPKSLK